MQMTLRTHMQSCCRNADLAGPKHFTQWLHGVFALVFFCAEEDGKDLLGEVVVRVVDTCVRVDYVVINCRIL